LTRRALLQTILCELNSPYHHPSEQELRLELFPAIRALQPKREALVLICDEAHQLPDSLLEELRILADFAEAGRPLVRLVLVGQLGLEEKLAQPGLEAFNQRIRAHLNLSTYDLAGSLDYIDYRLTWAGGRTDEIFTPQAIDLIAKVSDGVPRCINQLADHTLLLAFVAEQRPAGEELVREALNDLRQLPLHWNEPSQSFAEELSNRVDELDETSSSPRRQNSDLSEHQIASTSNAMYSFEPSPEIEEPAFNQADPIEVEATSPQLISHDDVPLETSVRPEISLVDMSSEDWRMTLDLFNSPGTTSDFVDAFSQLVSLPGKELFDQNPPASSASELQFQDILNEAFIAAESSPYTASDADLSDRVESLNNINSPQAIVEFGANQFEHSSANSIPVAATTVAINNKAQDEFQEEIVVDRYASIDAGFEPPAASETDTARQDEVRIEPIQVDQTTFEIAAEKNSESTDGLEETGLDGEDAQQPPVWEGIFALRTDRPHHSTVSNLRNDIEQVLDDVGLSHQSLQRSVPAKSSSDSLLQAIVQEVDELTSSVGEQSSRSSESDSHEPSWESIETPPAEPKSEARPFRYLFSKLRRKQQGLS
jgi:hypothetical protein